MSQVSCGFDGDQAHSRQLLIHRGPTLTVDIGFDVSYDVNRPRRLAKLPGKAQALIDTGASICCIDARLAAELDLPTIDRTQVAGIGGTATFSKHLIQIRSPELKFTLHGAFAAVDLSGGWQGHQVLIGRDFLSHFRLAYDGVSGQVALTDPTAPLPVDPWADE